MANVMEVMMDIKLSQESMKFLNLQKLDRILLNRKELSKPQILNMIADLRDEVDRFC